MLSLKAIKFSPYFAGKPFAPLLEKQEGQAIDTYERRRGKNGDLASINGKEKNVSSKIKAFV